MRIALVGTRGVPAAYGGFETAVEEIGKRLVSMGESVVVYCRGRERRTDKYLGMRTVDLPAVRRKTAETLSHTLLSAGHATMRPPRPDVAFVFNAANSPLIPIFRTARIPVALHTDGLEWRRGKWGPAGQRYYLAAEAFAVLFSDALISDAEGIAAYYRGRYDAESNVIAYGAEVIAPDLQRLRELDLSPGAYHLVVARLEPENHVDIILEGAIRSRSQLPLVVVGSVPYPSAHSRRIGDLAASDQRIHAIGGIWDQGLLDTLYCGAALYLHGHSVGGTNPSLLRAMGAAAPTAAYDVSFNREVLGAGSDAYWRTSDEVASFLDTTELGRRWWIAQGQLAQRRIATHYRWDDIAEQYLQLARDLRDGRLPRPQRKRQFTKTFSAAFSDYDVQ